MSGTDSDDGARLSSPTSKRPRTDGRPVRATSGSATFAALSRACPLEHSDPRNTECARQLREAEKYEIAAQGDDYADSDLKTTNTEALAYAKAAATVLSMDVRLSEWTANLAGLKRALRREPFLGDFRTAQICEFVSSGSFEALRSFERNEPPIGSDGQRRIVNSARRSMHGAAAKREMGSVLGIGWRTAYQLYEGEHPNLPKVRSLAELKALRDSVPPSWCFGLDHHDELRNPVPAEEANAIRNAVLEIVDAQQGVEGGAWQASWVGGARRRMRPGHDVDLLVWHPTKAGSWGAATDECVLGQLLGELERRGLLRTRAEAWQMRSLNHRHRVAIESADGGTVRGHRRDHTLRMGVTTHGFENLSHDKTDRCFGVWRSPTTGEHHRVDLVVCGLAEELPFSMLAWTGSRLLNRLLRQRAIDLDLALTPHALHARQDMTVVIDARPGEERREIQLRALQEIPFELMRNEEDVLRVLAGGTDAFVALFPPTARNF